MPCSPRSAIACLANESSDNLPPLVGEVPEGRWGRTRIPLANLLQTLSLLVVLLLAIGCGCGTLEDPNDVATAGAKTPQVIQKLLQSASDELSVRLSHGEISDRQFHALMTQTARNYIAQAKDRNVTAQNASVWGDILVTARDWPDAEKALEVALQAEKIPSTEDYVILGQYINDTLRLARVKAELGKVPEAVKVARSAFVKYGKAKAPILPAVLYEIVPAGVGRGDDFDLAELIKDAIAQHESVIVDPNTDAGRNFLLASPHHIRRAWELAAKLYQVSGHPDQAAMATSEANRMGSSISL